MAQCLHRQGALLQQPFGRTHRPLRERAQLAPVRRRLARALHGLRACRADAAGPQLLAARAAARRLALRALVPRRRASASEGRAVPAGLAAADHGRTDAPLRPATGLAQQQLGRRPHGRVPARARPRARAGEKRPFVAWASFADPHHPFDAPAPWCWMHRPEDVDLPPARARDLRAPALVAPRRAGEPPRRHARKPQGARAVLAHAAAERRATARDHRQLLRHDLAHRPSGRPHPGGAARRRPGRAHAGGLSPPTTANGWATTA